MTIEAEMFIYGTSLPLLLIDARFLDIIREYCEEVNIHGSDERLQ